MTRFWHVGMAVPDLDQGMAEIGKLLRLAWRPVVTRSMTITDEYGRPHPVDCHVTFSLGGPFAVEMWKAIPGTPLAVPESGYLHHLGYWAEDYAAEKERLPAPGYPPFLSSDPALLISRGPATCCSNPVTCSVTSPTCAICIPRTPRSPGPPCCPRPADRRKETYDGEREAGLLPAARSLRYFPVPCCRGSALIRRVQCSSGSRSRRDLFHRT
jgi:hypothetical protein